MSPVDESAYQEALNWIHSTMRFGSRLGLERVGRLLSLLGNPEKDCEFLHVAGTNGKGSVTAMMAGALRASGYRTGTYISPYLEDFRERIVLHGMMIPKGDLASMVAEVRPRVQEMLSEGFEHPTEFEVITALAFLYYSRQECDYVSLEVGLGGRFDATNVVTPAVSTITTISFDHTERLGDTLGKIAFEKAGIIKPGMPVVTGVTAEEPLAVIRDRARELGSPLFIVANGPGADVTWEEVSYSMDGQVIDVRGPSFEYAGLKVPFMGRHQQQNASLAVASLELARPLTRQGRLYLDRAAVAHGIASTTWPGRLEVLSRKPTVILDGAHNPEGARVLAEAMEEVPRRRLICVLGILGDKAYKEVVSSVAPMCDHVVVTRPDTPRALDLDLLAGEVKRYLDEVEIEPDIGKAIDKALAKACFDDAVLCCGSLYLVGPVRTHLRSRLGMTGRNRE
jgi:dihydrofolate synthase/folylpolyglutamate synthase